MSPAVALSIWRQTHAYLDALRPIAHEAGRVVQEGMKPAITELSDPAGDHDQQAQGARGWRAAMVAARQDWAAATPPPGTP